MKKYGRFCALLKNLALSVGSLIFFALILEVLLRLFPVSMSLRPLPMNAANPVHRFEPNRIVTWSKFPNFSMRRTLRVNNYGFVNDIDYVPQATKPLLAVIGDSYVEAQQVATSETMHGKLSSLQDSFRVYSFGSSGTPLSGYIGYAKWVRQHFKPQKVIVVIVGNDFDESLKPYRSAHKRDSFDYFDTDKEGMLQWYPGKRDPGLTRRIFQRSYLAMYLNNNLELERRMSTVRSLFENKDDRYVGNTKATATEKRRSDSKKVVDAFLKLLPQATGLPERDIVLVVDALRPEIYDDGGVESAADSYFVVMREYLLAEAREKGIQTIDLNEAMTEDWRALQRRFEFPRDAHWNAHGHEVAARAVLESGFLDAEIGR